MKHLIKLIVLGLLVLVPKCQAEELIRPKNVDTRIVFGLKHATTGKFITGATITCNTSHHADGSDPTSYSPCSDSVAEIGSTGTYQVTVVAAEMNFDYVDVLLDSAASSATAQLININTSVPSAFTEIKGASWSSTTDTLHQLAIAIGGGTCAAAVWDELLTGHQTTNSAGKLIQQAILTTLNCQARRQ